MSGVETTPSSPETQKILDTEGRVDRFMKKYGMGKKKSGDKAKAEGQGGRQILT